MVIADPVIPVPPNKYGGTERVIALLCEQLQGLGHEVTLIAAAQSRNYGRLLTHSLPNSGSILSRAYRKSLFQLLSLFGCHGVDVIHNFGRLDYLHVILRTSVPLVVTFENPIAESEIHFLTKRRKRRLVMVSISDHQRGHIQAIGQWKTIHNAVDPQRFKFTAEVEGKPYLAFLGRLTRNKGVHVAIRVAKAAGMQLRIAGNISSEPGGRAYFEEQIQPHIGTAIDWVGEVDDQAKNALLGGAVALLMPVQWDEPFGIVTAESLACGTPVIAMRRGAMPEIIEDGVTGFLCNTDMDMIAAISRLGRIARTKCRQVCEERFGAAMMTKRYLEAYDAAIGQRD